MLSQSTELGLGVACYGSVPDRGALVQENYFIISEKCHSATIATRIMIRVTRLVQPQCNVCEHY